MLNNIFIAADFPVVGISGARCPSPQLAASASGFVAALAAGAWQGVLAVGCADGIDAIGRDCPLPPDRLAVFSAQGGMAWQLAARSSCLVSFLARSGGCLACFPGTACPPKLLPCASWRPAGGSGTWGTLCLALGTGVPVLLFFPGPAILAPAPVARRFSSLGPAWWLAAPPPQLALF